MKDFSGSSEELQRLSKLQKGVAQKMAEKKYSNQEMKSIKGEANKFRDNLKPDGRAQPLRSDDSKFSKARKKSSKINAVTNVASKIDWSNDGLYFVVFLVSVIGDIGTAMIGAVQSVPGGGWVLAVVFGVATQTFVIMISVIIMVLYLLNGHYKRRMAIMKIAVLMGFSFLELMPIATALPGFIGSFIINYAIVLYGRVVEDALSRSKISGVAIRLVVDRNRKAAANGARAAAWKG
jgi:hypothetical protein